MSDPQLTVGYHFVWSAAGGPYVPQYQAPREPVMYEISILITDLFRKNTPHTHTPSAALQMQSVTIIFLIFKQPLVWLEGK